MEKTFADKLREWTLYEDAHPGNLRGVIKEAAEEIESLTAERDRLRNALERIGRNNKEALSSYQCGLLARNTLKGAN